MALHSEISSLLVNTAIREVGLENRQGGFYPRYFLEVRWTLQVLRSSFRHLAGPHHQVHQVHGCGLGASVAAGSQDPELP